MNIRTTITIYVHTKMHILCTNIHNRNNIRSYTIEISEPIGLFCPSVYLHTTKSAAHFSPAYHVSLEEKEFRGRLLPGVSVSLEEKEIRGRLLPGVSVSLEEKEIRGRLFPGVSVSLADFSQAYLYL